VVVQFSLSACLLMAVMLMAQQVSFLRNKKLGFDKDNVVVVDVKNSEKTSRIFANELRKIKGVKDFTFETSTPSSQGHWGTIMSRENVFDNNRKSVTTIFADDKYCGLYNLKLVTGRLLQAADTNFISASLPKEKRMMKAVVNEKLVRELEFESNEAAIGQVVNVGVNTGKIEIVGVIANFDSGPLREVITPVFITPNLEECEQAGIKIEAKSHLPETIAAIEAAWKVAYPEGAFSYQFVHFIQNFLWVSHVHFLFRAFWIGGVHHTSPHQRNWYPQSIGCYRKWHCCPIIKRLLEISIDCLGDCHTVCLVWNLPMVTGLRLSH
jgi:putative ABC transport system permease protein